MSSLGRKLLTSRASLTDDERIELYIDGYHSYFKKVGLARLFNRNKDCLYTGYGYRCLIMNNLSRTQRADLGSVVKINNEYQSFSYNPIDIGNIQKYTSFRERLSRHSLVLVVKTMITGLDVWKYIEKHNMVNNPTIKCYPQQELCEVIAKFENTYEITYMKGLIR